MELYKDLDDRKKKILNAIIQTYQASGEPVGSRTISKFTDLKLSSATIRNEMADLEEMGYIIQPHTSAGRIPTDLGYRYYVDQLLKADHSEMESDEEFFEEEKKDTSLALNDIIIQRVDRLELLLKQLAKILATNTNYATMITGPSYSNTKLKFIQLSRMQEDKMLIVVVVDGNQIKNTIIDLHEEINDQDMLSLNLLLNSKLNGLSLNEINLGIIHEIVTQAGEYGDICRSVIDAVAEALNADGEEMQIYTSGATNFFRYPELTNSQTASDLIQSFEEKTELQDIIKKAVRDMDDSAGNVKVYIGDEMPVETLKDCSVVTANYKLKDGVSGTISIIGPKRMDYQKVMDAVKQVNSQLDIIFEEPSGKSKS